MDMAGPLFIRGPAEASPRREAGRQRPWETRQPPQEGGGGQASERAGVRGRAGGTHRSADLTHATQPSVRARRPHLHACAWAEPASRPHAPPLTLRTPPLPASKNTTHRPGSRRAPRRRPPRTWHRSGCRTGRPGCGPVGWRRVGGSVVDGRERRSASRHSFLFYFFVRSVDVALRAPRERAGEGALALSLGLDSLATVASGEAASQPGTYDLAHGGGGDGTREGAGGERGGQESEVKGEGRGERREERASTVWAHSLVPLFSPFHGFHPLHAADPRGRRHRRRPGPGGAGSRPDARGGRWVSGGREGDRAWLFCTCRAPRIRVRRATGLPLSPLTRDALLSLSCSTLSTGPPPRRRSSLITRYVAREEMACTRAPPARRESEHRRDATVVSRRRSTSLSPFLSPVPAPRRLHAPRYRRLLAWARPHATPRPPGRRPAGLPRPGLPPRGGRPPAGRP